MTIYADDQAQDLAHSTVTWSRVTRTLQTGTDRDGYVGMIEHIGGRYLATDGLGRDAGTYASEQKARAALDPTRLARREEVESRVARQALITASVASGLACIAAFTATTAFPLLGG